MSALTCIPVTIILRLIPPRAPVSDPRSIYSQLFRPEFVKTYMPHLSSDAFSGFEDPEQLTFRADIVAATRHLEEVVVPKVAALLRPNFRHLSRFLHYHGVNVRYLGALRTHARGEKVKAMLMDEMV